MIDEPKKNDTKVMFTGVQLEGYLSADLMKHVESVQFCTHSIKSDMKHVSGAVCSLFFLDKAFNVETMVLSSPSHRLDRLTGRKKWKLS
jgi:hypothetical protein